MEVLGSFSFVRLLHRGVQGLGGPEEQYGLSGDQMVFVISEDSGMDMVEQARVVLNEDETI